MVTLEGVKVHHFLEGKSLCDLGGCGHVPYPESERTRGDPNTGREGFFPEADSARVGCEPEDCGAVRRGRGVKVHHIGGRSDRRVGGCPSGKVHHP